MKKTKIIGIALSALILGSCASSNDVVDGGFFQKKKYNKGWTINKKSKVESTFTKVNDVELAKVSSNTKDNAESPADVQPVAMNNIVLELNKENAIASKQEVSKEVSSQEVAETSADVVSSNRSVRPLIKPKRNVERNAERNLNLFSSDNTSDTNDTNGVEVILLIILALLLPPVAVALYEGITTRFWIDLLLTFLFFLPGVVYALLIVLGVI